MLNKGKLKLDLFKMNEIDLFEYLKKQLLKYYRNITYFKDDYIYAEGNIPIMLVAHIDTVFDNKPKKIIYNSKLKLFYSNNGLGADDRAGVSAIINILESGYKPYVLFCNYEEVGAYGAKTASENIKIDNKINIIIELDRQGKDDFVTYNCENTEMDKYIENFGFIKSYGSFSDISVLCKKWGIGGVNLSIGYYDQHTKNEYLKIEEYYNTIKRVKNILKNCPKQKFDYIERFTKYDKYWDYDYKYNDNGYNSNKTYDSYNNDYNNYKEYYDYELLVDITPYDIEVYDTYGEENWAEILRNNEKEIIDIVRVEAIKAIIKNKDRFITKYR